MKIASLALPLLLVASLPAHAQPTAPMTPPVPAQDPALLADCQRIISSYRQLLLEGNKPGADDLKSYMGTLTVEGNWPDIDYTNKTVSGWKPLIHLNRVLDLYKAWRQPGTPFFNDEKTHEAAMRSLHWWLLNKPTESQWYHREISVPSKIRDVIILADTDLTGADRELAMKQLAQLLVGNTGANLVWSADLGLHDAALRGDGATAGALAKRLSDEIKISQGEGIQPDWSFHQHGARLQSFHYGGSFFSDAVRLGWQLHDTRWAWPAEKIAILSGLALDGMRWQMRGNVTVPSTLDRSVTRKGALRVNIQTTLRRLAQSDPKRAPELEAFAKAVETNQSAVQGFKWFPRSDFAVYHTPTSSFFLKTLSSRTLNSESINQENLLGGQLNVGDHYIMRDGQEYFDMMGSWDWKQLPGVTWPAWADVNWQGIGLRDAYSGAVTDGKSGGIAWQQKLQSKDKTHDFSVRNAVLIHNNIIVSTWSGLQNNGDGPVQTTLDQSRLKGEVWGGTDKAEKISGTKDGLTWVNHNSTGYIALQPGTLSVNAGPRTGNWKAINAQYPADPVTTPTFTASIHHTPGQTQGGYVILLNATPEQTRALAAKPTWQVRMRTPEFQLIVINDDNENSASLTAFFAPGKIPRSYGADRPCLIMNCPAASCGVSEGIACPERHIALRSKLRGINPKRLNSGANIPTEQSMLRGGPFIWISDPLQTGGQLNLDTEEVHPIKIDLPKDGASVCTATAPWDAINAHSELKTPFRPSSSLIRLSSLE